MLRAAITVQITAVLITRFITAREGRLAVAMWEKAIATGTDCYAVAQRGFRRRLHAAALLANAGAAAKSARMNLVQKRVMISLAALLAGVLAHSVNAEPVAESASAVLKDTNGQEAGTVSFTQTPAGVLLKLSLTGMPPGEHAFHIHTVGKCLPPSFESAGPHFNPGNTHHGIMAGQGHAGDMPNLHIPPTGALEVELIDAAITLDKGKPNSVFHSGGTAIVVHAGKDDYITDPDGNAGSRIVCGVISQSSIPVGRLRTP
jgi:Cu-Zn family superoxide dismutase